MKNISIYRPTSIDEAIQILSQHGTEAGVYAGGTDLLIRLKNRLKQAPSYLVGHQAYRWPALHQGRRAGRRADRRGDENRRGGQLRFVEEEISNVRAGRQYDLVSGAAQRFDHRRRPVARGLVPVSAWRVFLLAERRIPLLRGYRRQ